MSVSLGFWHENEKCLYLASDSCVNTGENRQIGGRKVFPISNYIWITATGHPEQIAGFETTEIYSMESIMAPPLSFLIEGITDIDDVAMTIYEQYASHHERICIIIAGFQNGLPRMIEINKTPKKHDILGLKCTQIENTYVIGTQEANQAYSQYNDFDNCLVRDPIETISGFFDLVSSIQTNNAKPISVSRPYHIYRLYCDHYDYTPIE